MAKVFPAKLPLEKPTDRPLSAAMERMYDVWNPHEDRGNVFFSNSRLFTKARFTCITRGRPDRDGEATT